MIEQQTTRKKLDILNFFYGVGASIILVAAMFKFKGWQHADTLFVVGLGAEAIVFLISAFEWKKDEEDEYQWEKVFPQLQNGNEATTSSMVDLSVAEGTQTQQVQQVMEAIVTLNQTVSSLNSATSHLTGSVKRLDDSYDTIQKSTSEYEAELKKLKEKLAATNKTLGNFEKFSI